MERDSGREKFALDWDTKRSKGDYSRYHRGPQVVSMHMCMTYIAGFLVYFESEILKRAHKNFSFVNGRYVGPIRPPIAGFLPLKANMWRLIPSWSV